MTDSHSAPDTAATTAGTRQVPDRVSLDGVEERWDAAWTVLVRALETGAPDLVVVPATSLAALRQPDWEVPAAIDRLAGAVSLSRRADRAGARVMAAAGSGR